jgi:hypothetical protein
MPAPSHPPSQQATPVNNQTPPRNASPYGNSTPQNQQAAPVNPNQQGPTSAPINPQAQQNNTPQQTPAAKPATPKTPISAADAAQRGTVLLEINQLLIKQAAKLQSEGKGCVLQKIDMQNPPVEFKDFIKYVVQPDLPNAYATNIV